MAATTAERWDAMTGREQVTEAGTRAYGRWGTTVNMSGPPPATATTIEPPGPDPVQQYLALHAELVLGLLTEELTKVNLTSGNLELPAPEQMKAAVEWIVARRVAEIPPRSEK